LNIAERGRDALGYRCKESQADRAMLALRYVDALSLYEQVQALDSDNGTPELEPKSGKRQRLSASGAR
jgi:hypothetical protein